MQSASNQLPTGFLSSVTNVAAGSYLTAMIDYNFWWVYAVWNYDLYTGDEETLNRLYPNICRLMLAAGEYRDEYGMLNKVPYPIFIDWAANDRKEESSILNALYYGTLGIVRQMAEKKRDDYMLAMTHQAQNLIRENFYKRFWCEEKRVFVDANYEGVPSSVISEAGNMFPIYFGLCEAELGKELLHTLFEEKQLSYVEACPFLAQITLQCEIMMGRTDLALQLLYEKWGERFVKKGHTSTPEEWSIDGSYRSGKFDGFPRSCSHAWSAGPAEFLIKNLNQMKILEPGGKKIGIKLQPLPFDYEICYPLYHGAVKVVQKEGKVSCHAGGEIEIVMNQ